VEPLKLCFKGQAWYLYGYCRDRQDNRLFKLSRMKNLARADQSFQRESPQHAPALNPLPPGEMVEVVLRLPGEMAFRAYDEFEQPEHLEDGSFLVRVRFLRGEGLFQYVLSFGEHAEVLEPPDVRSGVVERLKKMLARYSI
jgi:predicted DNA-binding transcriptional regulator YafY